MNKRKSFQKIFEILLNWLLFYIFVSVFFVFQVKAQVIEATQVIKTENVIRFIDPELERAIRRELRIPIEQAITTKDIAKLTKLEIHYDDVKNLSGLEYTVNLKKLHLIGTKVSDISPLRNLINLQKLILSGNQINDFSPLTNLINLQELTIGDNQIRDLSFLKNLINLQELCLCGNQIKDISPLANLTNLRVLELCENQISDISPLKNLINLQRLSITGTSVNDISPLKNLINLQWLQLGANKIKDISPLSSLINLEELYLAANQIKDISPLANLTNLRVLELWYNPISDYSPLRNLINLQKLDLSYNSITDLSFLINLTNLRELYLQDNQIKDISPLKNLVNLNVLYLICNQIADISPLKNLINLEVLFLDNNQISDISPLKNLINLRFLFLENNEITDISPLQEIAFSFNKYRNNWYTYYDKWFDVRWNLLDITPGSKTMQIIELLKAKKDVYIGISYKPQKSDWSFQESDWFYIGWFFHFIKNYIEKNKSAKLKDFLIDKCFIFIPARNAPTTWVWNSPILSERYFERYPGIPFPHSGCFGTLEKDLETNFGCINIEQCKALVNFYVKYILNKRQFLATDEYIIRYGLSLNNHEKLKTIIKLNKEEYSKEKLINARIKRGDIFFIYVNPAEKWGHYGIIYDVSDNDVEILDANRNFDGILRISSIDELIEKTLKNSKWKWIEIVRPY